MSKCKVDFKAFEEYEYLNTPEKTKEYNDVLLQCCSMFMNKTNAMLMFNHFNKVFREKKTPRPTAQYIQQQITQYKRRMAIKNNKPTSRSVYDNAFIDMSKCIKLNKDGYHCYDVNHGYTEVERDNITVAFLHEGNICLPFEKNVFVYSLGSGRTACLELTDNKNGTYSGTLWMFFKSPEIIQSDIFIRKSTTHRGWRVIVNIPTMKKPLGGAFPNIFSIVHGSMWVYSADEFEEIMLSDMPIHEKASKALDNILISTASPCLNILSHLDSYKSKSLYKLTNQNNIYVYSAFDNDTTMQYINELYPDYEVARQNSWLVNGYWKLLHDTQYGKDQKGIKIKGLDWVVPYSYEKEKQTVEENGSESMLVINHALKRAKERYGKDFTQEDLQQIALMCKRKQATVLAVKDKFGRLSKTSCKRHCYRVNYQNHIYDVVVLRDKDRTYRVVTFLPKPENVNYNIISCKDYNEVFGG